MSLRATLKATVARCVALPAQPATFNETSATGNATAAQQHPANPHGIRVSSATGTATEAQLMSCGRVKKDPLKVALVAPVAEPVSMTAHRLAKELIAAAMRRCDQFNDSDAAREEMRQDCLGTPEHLRADLLEHLLGQPAKPQ